MTLKMVKFGGDDWSNGDILDADDLMDTMSRASNEPWYKFTYDSTLNAGLIKFSSTIWQTESVRTTDGGANWGGSGYGTNYLASTVGAAGISTLYSSAASKYTTDSGATWNVSSVAPGDGNMTIAYCIHMFDSSVGVIGGDAGANESIYYTSDGGDNWTEASSGPAASVFAIVMASATVGYAIDDALNIWRTADGGDNWTDTTDDTTLTNTDGWRLVAIDTDTILIVGGFEPKVETYKFSTNTVTKLQEFQRGLSNETGPTNIIIATNGNYYWVYMHSAYDTGGGRILPRIVLYKYDGTSLYQRPLGQGREYAKSLSDAWQVSASTRVLKPVLIEVSAVLYVNLYDHILEINGG